MLIPRENRIRRPRGGGSVMEMMLLLPILFMLSFGLVDYGYYFYLKTTFQAAAAAGVRASAPATATNSTVTGVISTMLTGAGLPVGNYTVTLSPSDISTATSGSTVTVTVSASWATVGTHALGTAFGGISNSKTVSSAAAIVKE